jgi:putative oxidoreductase
MRAAYYLGRMIFGGFFIYNGVNHFQNRESMTQYAQSKNVPQAQNAVLATGGLLLLGGTSLALGIKPRLGAAAIVCFLAGVSPNMHDYWRIEDPGQRMNEQINFSKNMAMLGAALALMGSR